MSPGKLTAGGGEGKDGTSRVPTAEEVRRGGEGEENLFFLVENSRKLMVSFYTVCATKKIGLVASGTSWRCPLSSSSGGRGRRRKERRVKV
jgi:hypothetical protein